MLREREVGTKLNNNLSYNVIEDDPVAKNYMALAFWIAGVEKEGKVYYPRIDQALGAYGIREREDPTRINVDKKIEIPEHLKKVSNEKKLKDGDKRKKKSHITATNINTGQVIKFDYLEEAADYFNVTKQSINYSCTNNSKLKKEWSLIKNKSYKTRNSKFLLINTNTGEEVLCKSYLECANLSGYSPDYVHELAKYEKITKKGIKIIKVEE